MTQRLAATVTLSLLAGCAGADDPSVQTPPPLADPGVIHVHGLGIDPSDAALYAATHSGLFRVEASGRATRIADRYQDTMGFTVTSEAFLGSGHPDLRENLPPRLGLIRSTDKGLSWQAVSLQGDVDFHLLRASGDHVYGVDAADGTLMVSTDGGQSWRRGAKSGAVDLAVNPVDPNEVLVTTSQAIMRSTDAGRSFRRISGPGLMLLDWSRQGLLYGVSRDGTVYHSVDAAATWSERGRAQGPVEALAVAPGAGGRDTVYVAVADVGIDVSTDGGATFAARYRAPA